MTDPFSEGVKTFTNSIQSSREVAKGLTHQIEQIQKDGIDVAQQLARERHRQYREAELRKANALTRALESWKQKKQISEEEARLKTEFVKKYGAKEWEALLRIKVDIENLERKENEDFQHDLKEVRRVQFWCFVAALIVTLWLKFVLGVI